MEGETVTIVSNTLNGITICNVPISKEGFVKRYLEQKKNKITSRFEKKMMGLLDPGRWPYPELPSQQMFWILIVVCFQFIGDYWLRYVRPDYT